VVFTSSISKAVLHRNPVMRASGIFVGPVREVLLLTSRRPEVERSYGTDNKNISHLR
jgi:hypothetical protein